MNPLIKLIEYGQSYWLDNLTRMMIRNGELAERVRSKGLRGVTSNPAIFNKAISGSTEYDEQIKTLALKGKSVVEIYEELTVSDIKKACDVLRTVYRRSKGLDGFVSLEVSPYLAHDTDETLREARRLYKAVNRPNLMIKIPGTEAGVSAIEQALYEGINVNITLLFSIDSYEAVALAFLNALERRRREGLPIDRVSSVASFFLSRIDVLIDQLLSHRIRTETLQADSSRPERLFGLAAIANAKIAYQRYLRIFGGSRWKRLEAEGAHVQRLLWASTSTKDPLYKDVRYVEPLIGKDTVNTMPDETITAFEKRGRIDPESIRRGIQQACRDLEELGRVGIDLGHISAQLQNEGVQKFIEPFNQLMGTLAHKRSAFLGRREPAQSLAAGPLGSILKSALSALDQRQFGRRLMAGDAYLWTEEPSLAESIKERLGWIDSPSQFLGRVEEIKDFAGRVKEKKFRHVVLLGMGGSSLCPEMWAKAFGPARGWPTLLVLDNTDPAALRRIAKQVEVDKTLFIVASKSGTTIETDAFYRYFYSLVGREKGSQAGQNFVAITDPGTPLAKEAANRKFLHCFENPADIGGRFSALSFFGLIPFALLGRDVKGLLERSLMMKSSCGAFIPAQEGPAIQLGALLGLCAQQGRDKVTMYLSESLSALADWIEQLLAESTGKEGKGLIPVVGEDTKGAGNDGQDRVFVSISLKGDRQIKGLQERLKALEDAGYPVVRIELADRLDLGAEIYRWEIATSVAGAILRINPFDEPNVSLSKEQTRRLLEDDRKLKAAQRTEFKVSLDGLSASWDGNEETLKVGKNATPFSLFRKLAGSAEPSEYVAILPYFVSTPKRNRILDAIRKRLRRLNGVTTLVSYGPRYLHSTGQLHKGGPNRGLFILLTAEPQATLPVPGKRFDFGTLQLAQALGDFKALKQLGRSVVRFHFESEIEAGLEKLAASLK